MLVNPNTQEAGVSWVWWRMLLILALRRQRLVDLCEIEASPVYRVSSRTTELGSETPLSQKQNKISPA